MIKYHFGDKYLDLAKNILGENYFSGPNFHFLQNFRDLEYDLDSLMLGGVFRDLFHKKNEDPKKYFCECCNSTIKYVDCTSFRKIIFNKFNIFVEVSKYSCFLNNGDYFNFYLFMINYHSDNYFYNSWELNKNEKETNEIRISEHYDLTANYNPKFDKKFVRCDKVKSDHKTDSISLPGFDISVFEKNKFIKYLQFGKETMKSEHLLTTYKVKKL